MQRPAAFDRGGLFKLLKNLGFSTSMGNAEIRAQGHEFPDWEVANPLGLQVAFGDRGRSNRRFERRAAVFIFLRKRKRFLPKNAILTYTPTELIEHGEVCEPPHARSLTNPATRSDGGFTVEKEGKARGNQPLDILNRGCQEALFAHVLDSEHAGITETIAAMAHIAPWPVVVVFSPAQGFVSSHP